MSCAEPPLRVADGALLLRVRGVVQGVGLRPTVWRVARELGLTGSVRNDPGGVTIAAWGARDALARLPQLLRRDCPPLARIDAIDVLGAPAGAAPTQFRIDPSDHGSARTEVAADAATCAECLREVLDAGSRRWRHGFANCTHCGPRYSIVRGVPYDRASTSMSGFVPCARCAAEYADPADRRFHAQPVACPDCGPRLWLERDGRELAGDALAQAAALLRDGQIVAVKGIGGFHLLADAEQPEAVARLRQRKRRPHKPLALIARDAQVVRRYAAPTPRQLAALGSPAAPVVLLRARGPRRLPDAVAPDTDLLGFMLPMSPLHHLLLAGFDGALVCTSGNASGEPPCIDNDEARARLRDIADAFVLHDRPIVNRLDDSVLRDIAGVPRPLRRGRGYAPGALALPDGFGDAPRVTALGAQSKNTACLLGAGRAVLSQHFGDLGGAGAAADAARGLERLSQLFDHAPQCIAVDLHDAYEATQRGRDMAVAHGLALAEVQHHHAHIAACMAEHGHPLQGAPVLGLALDGLGLGDDATLWGGELLRVRYARCERVASLRASALPGGDAASRQPWRNLAAQLLALPDAAALLARHAGDAALGCLQGRPMDTLARMVRSARHAPPASSTGRLLDAVAAALGLHADAQSFEGQAAMALERLAGASADTAAYPFALLPDAALPRLDPAPLWPLLLDDLRRGHAPAAVARRFLRGLAEAWAGMLRGELGRHAYAAIALSGGVFQNDLFSRLLLRALGDPGVPVWMHRQVPCNDGGVALGQAVVAAARALQT